MNKNCSAKSLESHHFIHTHTIQTQSDLDELIFGRDDEGTDERVKTVDLVRERMKKKTKTSDEIKIGRREAFEWVV